MSDVSSWSITAASNNSASPDGFPEGMPPSALNDSCREVMAAVARYYREGANQSSQSSNYTLVLTDANKHILHPSGGGASDTFTIPANASVAFPLGTIITFVNDDSNAVSIAITTDTLVLAGAGTTGTRTLAQNGLATAMKITSTKWLISGVGLS
jgi:hypothetical protein